MAMNNTCDPQRIIWMMDETVAQTKPVFWEQVNVLENRLVNTIGKTGINHEVVNPIPCLRELAKNIKGKEFSAVFDLTGWLTPAMQELFPETPIENRFSLSRVRVVSSPQLETTGYRVSLSPEEIEEAKKKLDLRKPLIIDDVSFSGWTIRKTMQLWGMNPQDTTCGFLIANSGSLGEEPGAVSMLETLGSTTSSGFEMQTPRDDGWHLKDLHQHPHLKDAFSIALHLQEAINKNGAGSTMVQRLLSNKRMTTILFPDSFTSEQIKELAAEGKFILKNSHVINGNETHARNPFLWASPYFQHHVDMNALFTQGDAIIQTLEQLQSLTVDPEGKAEASLELRKEIKRVINVDPETTRSMRGKERW